MCWFSQEEEMKTRRATEGEELVVHDFKYEGRWLASPKDFSIPVCIPDGCKLKLSNIPKKLQKKLRIGAETVVEFREIHEEPPKSLVARIFLPLQVSLDVLVFPDGKTWEVAMLPAEVQVDVLSAAIAAPPIRCSDVPAEASGDVSRVNHTEGRWL